MLFNSYQFLVFFLMTTAWFYAVKTPLQMVVIAGVQLLLLHGFRPEFQKQTELLYWPTDTHWNNRGIRIAVEQTLKAVSQSKF